MVTSLQDWVATWQGDHSPDLIPSKTSTKVATDYGSSQSEFFISS